MKSDTDEKNPEKIDGRDLGPCPWCGDRNPRKHDEGDWDEYGYTHCTNAKCPSVGKDGEPQRLPVGLWQALSKSPMPLPMRGYWLHKASGLFQMYRPNRMRGEWTRIEFLGPFEDLPDNIKIGPAEQIDIAYFEADKWQRLSTLTLQTAELLTKLNDELKEDNTALKAENEELRQRLVKLGEIDAKLP